MFRKGDRVRTIGKWNTYTCVFIIDKKHKGYLLNKRWIVSGGDTNNGFGDYVKYIPEECLVLEEIYNSDLMKSLNENE